MNWRIITKDPNRQPTSGTYHDWKPLLAQEGFNQCVYCAIHESAMGGIRNFHVEHYRPKSLFSDRENDYFNLFYACPICNTFKSNDWPNEPVSDNSVSSYPNPSEVDYNSLFVIDSPKGLIEGKNVASKYIQERLFLNRPQLISARRLELLKTKVIEEIESTTVTLGKLNNNPGYHQFVQAFLILNLESIRLLGKLNEIPQYQLEDVQRQ
jgi:hypothetical protein